MLKNIGSGREKYWVGVNFIQGVTTSYVSGLPRNKLSQEGGWDGGVGNKDQLSSDERELGLGQRLLKMTIVLILIDINKEKLRKKT